MTYTVIVAEDEELLLTNLVQKIQKADPDFQVAGTAQTGDQALALVEKLSPDLVVTDIRMPVMDGITLLTKVREQFPFTKFIITSITTIIAIWVSINKYCSIILVCI